MNPHAASNVNDKDERQHRFTPRKLMESLHAEFHFTMDACGHPLSPASQIIGAGYTLVRPSRPLEYGNCYGYPGTTNYWRGKRVWLQPDFAKVEEAVRESHLRIQSGCDLIVLLMPWNRQEQPWWHEYIEPYRDGRQGAVVSTRALKGRVKFGTPDDPEGVKKHPKLGKDGHPITKNGQPIMMPNAPGFDCGLVIWCRN